MINYHLIGSRSFIANALGSYLKSNGFTVYEYSSAENLGYLNFIKNLNHSSVVIYFSIIKDSIDLSLFHLNKFLTPTINAQGKFIYISSINAEFQDESYYSRLKFECESMVLKNFGYSLRLGLVTTNPPKGPHNSLLKLSQSPIRFKFSERTMLITTNLTEFINFDFDLLQKNIPFSLYSSQESLNIFLDKFRTNPYILTVNLSFFIFILKKCNRIFKFKGFIGRLLTLNAFQR